jgi:hypothetical protein
MKMATKNRAIDKIYKRRDRYEIPEWQRQEVWSRSKRQNLIDSILRGWKLPKFYLLRLKDDLEEYEVVDGQQRLAAIFEFFDNDLPLADDTANRVGAAYYRDLPDAASDLFDDYEIEFDEITDASEEEIKQFFQRLQDGLPLTSSEKLNSIHSKLRDFVVTKSKHKFLTRISASDKRYGHFDILAKTAAIEIDGIEVGLRYDELRALFESQAAFSAKSNAAKRITGALDYAENGFTDEQAALLRNRTMVQSLLTLICRVQRSRNAWGRESVVAKFFAQFITELGRQVELGQKATDLAYLRFQRTVNANVKVGAQTRQEILLRKLLAHDPTFVDAFDAAALAEAGVDKAIRELGTEISDLVTQANKKHSAKHGDDLFKPTNKTVEALLCVQKPIRNEDEYGSFVDDLYFLFHEGPGTRLGGNAPVSFSDVNTLRTDLRHDVDHGKEGKVRAKKKKSGATFKKYSGVATPSGLAPERFAVVQLTILDALKRGLTEIVESL